MAEDLKLPGECGIICYGSAVWRRALSDEEILVLNGPPCPAKDALLAEATSRSGCFMPPEDL